MIADRWPAEKQPNDTAPARRPLVRGGWILVGLLVLLGMAALAIDHRAAYWCATCETDDLRKPFDLVEVFGHGIGVALLLLVVWVLDPASRWAIARLATASYGAGMAANLVKMTLARARPRAFDFSQGIFESFGQCFPLGAGGSNSQSLPSAHVATAVGLALGFSWLYPRGRWLFLVLAAMVAAQRMMACAHFCSDAFFGAAVGCVVAILCFDVGPLARWFDRKEAEWREAKA